MVWCHGVPCRGGGGGVVRPEVAERVRRRRRVRRRVRRGPVGGGRGRGRCCRGGGGEGRVYEAARGRPEHGLNAATFIDHIFFLMFRCPVSCSS